MVFLRYVFLFALTAFSTASASATNPFHRRGISTIPADLQTINKDVLAVTKAANGYKGTQQQFQYIVGNLTQLNNDIIKANDNAATVPTGSGSDAQCLSLYDYLNNTLEPNVKAMIQALIDKAPVIETFAPIKTGLQKIYDNTVKFMENLCRICRASGCQPIETKLKADIQRGITAFS